MDDDLLGTLGSIVGIGVGLLELRLDNHAFVPGETVHGCVALKLKKKTEAKRLVAAVEASEERTSRMRDPRGVSTRHCETVRLYRFEHQLDGKRTYYDEVYDLHLPLPSAIETPAGTLGDVARLVSAVARVIRGAVFWRVHVFLDIPWKVNVRTRGDISVG